MTSPKRTTIHNVTRTEPGGPPAKQTVGRIPTPSLAAAAPEISVQPQHSGEGPARLEVRALSSAVVRYQWQTRDDGEGTWEDVAGGEAKTPVLNVPAQDPVAGGGTKDFRCVVTNGYGETISNVVEVDVPAT